MKKCSLCPYKKHCGNECYGENPCDFAIAFDKLQKKNDCLKAENELLKSKNEQLDKRLDAVLHPNF